MIDCVGRHLVGLAAALHELGRRAFALAEARPAMDLLAVGFERPGERLGAGDLARRVHADVVHRLIVARIGGAEQLVEGGNAVALGGRHLERGAEVVEAAGADPAGLGLQRMEPGEQQVAALAPAVRYRRARARSVSWITAWSSGAMTASTAARSASVDVSTANFRSAIATCPHVTRADHQDRPPGSARRACRCGWRRP